MRGLAFLLVSLCLAAHLAAGQNIAWEKRIGWRFYDELTDVISLGDTVFIACGTSRSYGTEDLFQNHFDAVTLICFDIYGDTLWHKPLPFYGGSARLCSGDSVGFYMVATSSFIPPTSYDGETSLFKISYDGTVLWQRSVLGTTGNTVTQKAIRTRNGNILIAGRRPAFNNPPNLYDMFVIGMDTAGLVYFNERYNDHQRTFGNYIEETPRGTFLASGAAGSRIWAIEIDSMGREIQRQTVYQTPTRAVLDETACVKQAPGGRFIASGNPLSYSPNFFYLGSYSALSSSSEIWGGEKTNASCLMPQIQDDGSIVLLNVVDRSYFTKFRADSSVVWNLAMPRVRRTVFPLLNAFTYLQDSSVVAVGIYLDDPDPMNTAPDYYFTRIQGIGRPYIPSEPTATKAVYRGLPLLIAYPTPATTTLIVHSRAKETLQLMNLSGQVVLAVRPELGGTTQLDMASLPSGMYLLRQGQAAVKVVKE
ncbi:T9SS type A sorting domain-containing protein [Nostoc sp. NIES-2111]